MADDTPNINWKKVGLWGGLAVLAIGTVAFVKKQQRLIGESQFNFVGVKFLKSSLKELNMVLIFTYDNKSDISFYVRNQIYDVYFNDRKAKTLVNTKKISVPAKKKTIIPIQLNLTPKEVLSVGVDNLSDIVYDPAKINMTIKGSMVVGSGILEYKKLPVDYDENLKNLIKG